jgi:hypothetical protein
MNRYADIWPDLDVVAPPWEHNPSSWRDRVPNRASLPPKAWLDFYAGEQRRYEPGQRADEAQEKRRS